MIADTTAIAGAGADLSRSAAELDGIAAALPAAITPCVAALGPVGADFLTAVACALDESAGRVAGLGADLAAAVGLAARTAVAYADAERRTAGSVAALGG